MAGRVHELRAVDVTRDDVIYHEDRWLRVLDDPETVHQGLGLFDEFRLLVGIRCVDETRPSGREYVFLDPNQRVIARRGEERDGDHV